MKNYVDINVSTQPPIIPYSRKIVMDVDFFGSDVYFGDSHKAFISMTETTGYSKSLGYRYEGGYQDEDEDLAECMSELSEKFSVDMAKLLGVDSLNDVTIILEDGEIKACKAILVTRSEYFETMLNNENFKEGKSKVIELKNYKKGPMMNVIRFIYSGLVEFDGLDNKEVFILMEMFRFFLMNDAYSCLERIIKRILDYRWFVRKSFEHRHDHDHVDAMAQNLYCLLLECLPIVVDLKLDEMKSSFIYFLTGDGSACVYWITEKKGDGDCRVQGYLHASLKAMSFETFKLIADQEFHDDSVGGTFTSVYKNKCILVNLYIELHEDSLDENQKKEIVSCLEIV